MLDKQKTLDAIAKLKKESKKRSFAQTFDLVISLRDFNIKKGARIDDYVTLPFGTGRKSKFCALVGKELSQQAKKFCDTTILVDEFSEWATKPREIKKLVRRHHYFIAQANLMPQIAKTFGKYLGSKGRMPNPKLGLVIPPTGDVEETVKKVGRIAILKAKKQPNIHMIVGSQEMKDEEVWENIKTAVDKVLRDLPKGKQQLRHISLKLTMTKPEKLV